MKRPNIGERHRDKNGDISRKHGNTLVRTLRKIYRPSFAVDCKDDEKLSDVLHKIDAPSLSQMIYHHEAGQLGNKIRDAER